MIDTTDENVIAMVTGTAFSQTLLIDPCGKPVKSLQCLDCVNIATTELGYSLADIECVDNPLDKLAECQWCQMTDSSLEFWNSFETEEPPPLLAKILFKEFKRELYEAKSDNYRESVRDAYYDAVGFR